MLHNLNIKQISNEKFYSAIIVLQIYSLALMQLGVNFYLSFQMASFILVIFFAGVNKFFEALFFNIGIVAFFPLILTPFFQPSLDVQRDILYSGRIFLCFLVLYVYVTKSNEKKFDVQVVLSAICHIVLFFTGFVVLQKISFMGGSSFYFPSQWYIANEGTIANDLAIEWGFSRPSASFGEPSYFGFILFSIYVSILPVVNRNRLTQIIFVLLWCNVLLSSSLSGLVAFIMISFVHFYKNVGREYTVKYLMYFTFFASFVIMVGVKLFPEEIGYRLEGLWSGDVDESSNGRIGMALSLAVYALNKYPLGASMDVLVRELGYGATLGTDNGFLLMIANFGLGAIFMYILIAFSVRKNIVIGLYLVLSAFFNGSIFSFDKVSVMSLVILLNSGFIGEKFSHQK